MGAVLCGGASRRMGRPKAMVEVDGVAMVARVVGALRDAGAVRILQVGGDPTWSEGIGAEFVADRWPGQGPLAGTATALGAAAEGHPDALVAVAACDQPWLAGLTFVSLVDALQARPSADVAAAGTPDGRRHPFPSVWGPGCAAVLRRLVEAGERRAEAAFVTVSVADVVVESHVIADVDRPEDLGELT